MNYNIFSQLQGPNINEALFANVGSAGVQAGNQVATPVQAAIEGATKGIETGQKINANIQQEQLRQIEIENAPLERQRLEQQLEQQDLDSQIKTLELQIRQGSEQLEKETYVKGLEAKKAQLMTQAQDISKTESFSKIASSTDDAAKRAILNDPDFGGWVSRNKAEAQAILGQISPVLDDEQRFQAGRMIDYIKTQDAEAELSKADARARNQQAEKLDSLYNKVQSNGALSRFTSGFTTPTDLAKNVKPVPFGPKNYQIQDAAGNNRGTISNEEAGPLLELLNAHKATVQAANIAAGRDPNAGLEEPSKKEEPVKQEPAPNIGNQPAPQAGPAPVPTNATIAKQKDSTFAANRNTAQQTGRLDIYVDNVAKGQMLVPNKTPPPNVVTTPQNTAVPPSQPKLTNPLSEEQNQFFNDSFGTPTAGRFAEVPSGEGSVPSTTPSKPVSDLGKQLDAAYQELKRFTDAAPDIKESNRKIYEAQYRGKASEPKEIRDQKVKQAEDSAAAAEAQYVDKYKELSSAYDKLRGDYINDPALREEVQEHYKRVLPPTKPEEYLNKKVSALISQPTARVSPELQKVSTKFDKLVSPQIYQTINSIEGLKDYSPVIKGMIAVESRGNPFALSPAGAGGLMQLMPGTAAEMGLEGGEVFDPAKNVEAGAAYFQKQINNVQKALAQETDKTGFPIDLDIRFAFAAYNGGFKHIKNGIAAGNYTWPEMVDYLKSVKSPKNAKENTEYPDKVIAATIAFMKGGNLVDDNLMKHMITHGMVDV